MSRKLLNDVDGDQVDEYAGTFTGTFEVSGVDAKYMPYDDEVLLVVRARAKVPRLKETAKGELVRVNVLAVKEVGVVRSEDLKKHLCETLGLDVPQPQLEFEGLHVPEAPAVSETPSLLPVPTEVPKPVTRPVEEPVTIGVVGSLKPRKDARLAAFLEEPS
jgi:hypothetical protein